MKPKVPAALLVSGAAAASVLTAPLAAAPAAAATTAACRSDKGVTTSPALGGSATYNVNVYAKVVVSRPTPHTLKVLKVYPRKGYVYKVLLPSGLRVQISVHLPGSTRYVYFGANTGKVRPERLHWNVTFCGW